jgi:hypothetical protein
MHEPNIINADYWRTRAEEARILAAQLTCQTSQEAMWGIAKSYDTLAATADKPERPGVGRPVSWNADISDGETARLLHLVSCSSFEELRSWLTDYTAVAPSRRFAAKFAIPMDAPDSHREELEALVARCAG